MKTKSDEVLLKKLGKRIRALRLEKGWTLEETEERGYPSWRHLQKVEAGEKNINFTTLYKISKVLNYSPAELLKTIK